MKKPLGPKFAEYAKIFDYVRQKNDAPAKELKPQRYTFEPARRPDMMLAQRPRLDLRAADAARTEIQNYASKARDLYKERRLSDRPSEARDYVRHQLALGMLDTPSRKPINGDYRLDELDKRVSPAEKPSRSMLGFLRRKQPE